MTTEAGRNRETRIRQSVTDLMRNKLTAEEHQQILIKIDAEFAEYREEDRPTAAARNSDLRKYFRG